MDHPTSHGTGARSSLEQGATANVGSKLLPTAKFSLLARAAPNHACATSSAHQVGNEAFPGGIRPQAAGSAPRLARRAVPGRWLPAPVASRSQRFSEGFPKEARSKQRRPSSPEPVPSPALGRVGTPAAFCPPDFGSGCQQGSERGGGTTLAPLAHQQGHVFPGTVRFARACTEPSWHQQSFAPSVPDVSCWHGQADRRTGQLSADPRPKPGAHGHTCCWGVGTSIPF